MIGLRYLQPPKQIIWPNLADSLGGGKVGGDEHIFRVLAWLLPLSAESEVWCGGNPLSLRQMSTAAQDVLTPDLRCDVLSDSSNKKAEMCKHVSLLHRRGLFCVQRFG